jgi:sugar/nucleoside kinase (ribokinase family)
MKQFDITLAGETNVDLLFHGLPEALPTDRELLADGMALALGGSPAITAHNLAALGSRTGFITVDSGDLFAGYCMKELSAAGVDLSCAVRPAQSSGTGVTVLLEHGRSRRTLTFSGATHELRFQDLNLDYLTSARHFHLSSYFLLTGLRRDIPRLLAHLKQAGLTISLDPNDDPAAEWGEDFLNILQYIDVLMPNERETCAIARENDPAVALRKLAAKVPLLVVKQGRRGATGIEGGKLVHVDAAQVSPVDAVGAGDSFNAGFLHEFVSGSNLESCMRLGNFAGAFSTTAAGGTRALADKNAFEQFAATRQ